MAEFVKIKLGNGVESSCMPLYNKSEWAFFLNLDSIVTVEFEPRAIVIRLNTAYEVLEPFDVGYLEFSDDAMGEYHRLKRELEEYMGQVGWDKVEEEAA